MIPVDELMYDIDLKLNKLASNVHQSINNEDKVIIINEAQIHLVKQKLDLNNVYKSGIDSFNKRYDDLQILVRQSVVDLTKVSDRKYEGTIPQEYMFFMKAYCNATKGNCTEILDINLIPHADVEEWFNNSHLKPSFEYNETFCTISDNKIEVYTTDFVIGDIVITYLKYPVKVDYPGYIHFDDTESTSVNCELPYYLKDELIAFAVEELARSTENLNAVQLTKDRIQNNE